MKQESIWYWVDYGNGQYGVNFRYIAYNPVSAFTVAELGEKLQETKLHFNISFNFIVRTNIRGMAQHDSFNDENEANLRAKMLIYLIENKLINLGEPNE